jgi:hypothetical protein
MIMDDFFTKGFTYTFDHDLIKHIREEDLCDPESWFQSDEGPKYPLDYDLSAVMEYLQETYVTPLFGESEKGYSYIWSRNEKSAQEWHNDLIEGPNLFFLYYLNDVYVDGEIRFRINGVETGRLQPRLGLLVMGSQESHVEHKAEPTTETRILSNFAFYVNMPRTP